MQLINTLSRKLTTPPEWIPSSSVRSYVLNNYIITFVLCGHILFTPVFYLLGDRVCFYNNILCIFVDLLSLWLNSGGGFRAVYIIFCSAISYHTFISQVTFGPDSGFVFYFPALAVFIFIFREYRFLRFGLFVLIIMLFISQMVILHFAPVFYTYKLIPSWLIYILNAAASFFGIAFIATFFSKAADRAEAMLVEAKEKAEEGTRAKSIFLANMSHEIRTPLNSVAGMVTLAIMADTDEERGEFLHIAKDSADHLLTVINDILDYSKIEESRMDLHYENFNIFHLVSNTVKALSTGLDRGKVEMYFSIAEDIPVHLNGDPSRIRQVLINLLNNAIKFTGQGVIKLDVVKKGDDCGRIILEFTVSDTGIGIPANRINSIFESFVQLEESGKARLKGTGLGLTISKELVELMGGSIRVESKPGEGSIFSFDIPLRPEERREMSHEPVPAHPASCPHEVVKVLVGEDDVINRLLIEQYLGTLGYTYKVVENGRMVLEELESSIYDIVILDIEMPDIGGVEAVQMIRSSGSGYVRNIPVVAMTGYAAFDFQMMQMDQGFSGYLSKPFSLRDLEGIIRANTVLAGSGENAG